MKTKIIAGRLLLDKALCAGALVLLAGATQAQLLVEDHYAGSIGEYSLSGAPLNPSLISGLSDAFDLAVSGNAVYVRESENGGFARRESPASRSYGR
jgi:hypothetical protein